jgi:hypothetical protein
MRDGLTGFAVKGVPLEHALYDKLDRYLLNPDHPVGRSKANRFESALGFNQSNASGLAQQIVFDEGAAVQTATIEQGVKFNQVISINGANGKVIDVNLVGSETPMALFD